MVQYVSYKGFYRGFLFQAFCVAGTVFSGLVLSLINPELHYNIIHMHTLVSANSTELHRFCQPHCDTKHDNVCNLLGVVCLPLALPFEVLPPVSLQPSSNSTAEPTRMPVLCLVIF